MRVKRTPAALRIYQVFQTLVTCAVAGYIITILLTILRWLYSYTLCCVTDPFLYFMLINYAVITHFTAGVLSLTLSPRPGLWFSLVLLADPSCQIMCDQNYFLNLTNVPENLIHLPMLHRQKLNYLLFRILSSKGQEHNIHCTYILKESELHSHVQCVSSNSSSCWYFLLIIWQTKAATELHLLVCSLYLSTFFVNCDCESIFFIVFGCLV